VFLAGPITAVATGVGAVPFSLVADIDGRWNVGLRGVASGTAVRGSLFGPVGGPATGTAVEMAVGGVVGVALVVAHRIVEDAEASPRQYEAAARKLVLVFVLVLVLVLVLVFVLALAPEVLTVRSFPGGVAIGVSFAELTPAPRPRRSMSRGEPFRSWPCS